MSENIPKPTFTLAERIEIVQKQILTYDWKTLKELRMIMIAKEPRFNSLFHYGNKPFNHANPICRIFQKLVELGHVDWKEEGGKFFYKLSSGGESFYKNLPKAPQSKTINGKNRIVSFARKPATV
jgi:hypothetical protein